MLAEAVEKHSGKYVCVVEGSIPTRERGIYMRLAGWPAMGVLADVGGKAAAVIAIGSRALWGGIPSADPNPTGAVGVADLFLYGRIEGRSCILARLMGWWVRADGYFVLLSFGSSAMVALSS